MVTRKRRAPAKKKAPAKKTSNSKVAEVVAPPKKTQSDSLRGQSGMERARSTGPSPYSVADGKAPAKLNPAKPVAPTVAATGNPTYPGDPNYPKQTPPNNLGIPDRTKASKQPGDADAPTGLLGLLSIDAPVKKQPLAITNPGLYGVSNKNRAAAISASIEAAQDVANKQLKDKGNAVYMGPGGPVGNGSVKIRNRGQNRFNEDGSTTTTEQAGVQVYSKDQLMGWLADETKVAQIKDAANKAGLDVQTYDDIAKLWASVLDTASAAYSVNGQKVTPWSVLQLRGKFAVNGHMPDKTTTSTNVDEMAPETARAMFEQTAQQALGRAPTKAEIDDFIAKAQTIAKSNPTVTRTTQHFNAAGDVTSQNVNTSGGGVTDKAQVAAMDQAKQSEDYAAYQAAGNYFPMLFDALKAPV